MNYHNEMLEIINNLDYRPKLLLHSCCGPCSTTVLSFLESFFDIIVYYYNPNIDCKEEFFHRLEEQKRFSAPAHARYDFDESVIPLCYKFFQIPVAAYIHICPPFRNLCN